MTILTDWQALNYDVSPVPMRFRNLLLFVQGTTATPEEREMVEALSAKLIPYTRLVVHPYAWLNSENPFPGVLVGMRVTLDGFLSTELVLVPYEEFDITRVPWNHVL